MQAVLFDTVTVPDERVAIPAGAAVSPPVASKAAGTLVPVPSLSCTFTSPAPAP